MVSGVRQRFVAEAFALLFAHLQRRLQTRHEGISMIQFRLTPCGWTMFGVSAFWVSIVEYLHFTGWL